MTSTSTPKRWIRTTVRAVTVAALALTAASLTGAASAQAATTTPARSTTAAGGAVLVKEVRGANGVLDVYEVRGPAAVDSSSGCAGWPLRVCFGIYGDGLFVNHMTNSTYFPAAGVVNMQINGPGGVIIESGNFYQSGNVYYNYTWTPMSNVAAGYYCGTSFTNTTRQGACETVHA
ncbi:hypothetical protein R8Z50_16380 [Longispora sp. K20-0274]|uniref:hypothetical protein n=1 Tax=Longispora sp. K20-0274 TaxID=3088255 RepID=UPI00399AE371